MKEKVYISFFVIGFFPGLLILRTLGVPSIIAGIIVGAIAGVLSTLLGDYLYKKGYIVNLISIIAFLMSALFSYFFFFFVVFLIDDEPNMYIAALTPIVPSLIVATFYIKREWKKYNAAIAKEDNSNI